MDKRILLVVAAVLAVALFLLLKPPVPETPTGGIEASTTGASSFQDAVQSNGRAIVFVPGYGTGKEAWEGFALKARSVGFATLAIDLNWSAINEEAYKSRVEEAVKLLESKGFEREDVMLAGASIGANVALSYAAEHQQVRAVVLMSPGEDYRGIESLPAAQAYQKPVFVVVSGEDSYSLDGSQRIHALSRESDLLVVEEAGHGTNMFSSSKAGEVEQAILAWLQEKAGL